MLSDELTNFLNTEKVCGLSVLLPNGEVHGAAMHFSWEADADAIYFSADSMQRKCLDLKLGEKRQASVIVGFSEETWITCQMSGVIEMVSESELSKVKAVHYDRVPGAAEFEDVETTVFLRFNPNFAKITDYNKEPPKEMVL